ncbi:hypothetical protein H1S01_09415 [Heliobacterium chlorum]|uniref:Uncharacterized protein n=1 Tax=Heliobacterium chlorum TaxID=2698 RepID=A0ABR7T1R7_HELCL|nr:hypothetical protein [Heliobacterium chlorum]MBC9784727.1 hypothetical protein [Heliobacterium chlorum]
MSFERNVLEYWQLSESVKELNERRQRLREEIAGEMEQKKWMEQVVEDERGEHITIERPVRYKDELDKDALAAELGVAKKDLTPVLMVQLVEEGRLTLRDLNRHISETQKIGLSIKKAKRKKKRKAKEEDI